MFISVRGMEYRQAVERGKERNSLLSQGLWFILTATVTNGTAPVSRAVVFTMGASNITDSFGNYSLIISSGTYNVTASDQPRYNDNTITNVVVSQGNTTILPIYLQEKPTGTITGVVRNA